MPGWVWPYVGIEVWVLGAFGCAYGSPAAWWNAVASLVCCGAAILCLEME